MKLAFPSPTTIVSRLKHDLPNLKHVLKVSLSALLTTLVIGCKVVIIVPEGGKVVSENGVECLAGSTCILDVTDTSFDDRFEAVPDDGYVFESWKQANSHFCGNSALVCYLTTTTFGGTRLEPLLSKDQNFYLVPVFTEVTPRYNTDEWAQLASNLDSAFYRSNNFLYQIVPNEANCDPGALNTEATERFLNTINLIRKLHYLPPVDYDAFYNSQMQQAALVQLANYYLSYTPNPADTCYSATAAAGAGSSNLSGGSAQRDPAFHALGWVNDNRNISSLMEAGHRRWVLYPHLGYTSYGQASGFSAMKVFGFNSPPPTPVSPDVEYVAFPYKDYPYLLVSNGTSPTPWSVSIVPPSGTSSRYDYFSQATVSIIETDTGDTLTANNIHSDIKGYGLANFFSWMVPNWEYDTDYTVTISNIQMPDSSVKEIVYNVKIDRQNLLTAP